MALTNATPHNGARRGQIAKRVIMPGDPNRAKWIAQTFLKKAKLVNDVRGMLAYTGTYKNVPVTVMAHGMGIPSICIYTHELYDFYKVKVIYRVGSCGVSNKAKCSLGDVILVKEAWSDTPLKGWINVKTDRPNVFLPSATCVKNIKKTAEQLKVVYKEKKVNCDLFFYKDISVNQILKKTGCDILEMEAWGLFMEARRNHAKAACLLTVSDNVDSGEAMSPEARATTFTDMIELALESIVKEKV